MPGSTQGISRRAILQLAAVGGVAGLTAARSPDAAAAFGPAPANLTGGPVKTRATYYTPERVQAARVNVAELAWAGRIRDTAVAAAQDAIDAGAEWLWDSVTTQGLPRSFAVNQDLGSPITGDRHLRVRQLPVARRPVCAALEARGSQFGLHLPDQ